MFAPDMAKTADKDGQKLIVKNRRALFDYHVEKRYEAGIELLGTEVKSIRSGTVNLSDAYAQPHKGQLFLHNCSIAAYTHANELMNHVPLRQRRLLLNRREIDDLTEKVVEKGYTLVPLSLYFKNGFVKVELGLCRGKTHGDQRQAIAEREGKREIDRAMRGSKRVRRA